MYIKLTNAVPEFKGTPVCIRKDVIIAVREGAVMRENGVADLVTVLFCPPHGTWEVSEPIDDVMDILNGKSSTKKTKKGKVELLNENSK